MFTHPPPHPLHGDNKWNGMQYCGPAMNNVTCLWTCPTTPKISQTVSMDSLNPLELNEYIGPKYCKYDYFEKIKKLRKLGKVMRFKVSIKWFKSGSYMNGIMNNMLLLSQGVERNPGPAMQKMQKSNVSIRTYNCNGLGVVDKFRRILVKIMSEVGSGGIV